VESVGSVSLLVDHVPPALNNITALNQYFSQFGVIINVQVTLDCFLSCFDYSQVTVL